MLVLSREVGQSIIIGHKIEVTVNKIAGGKVSLGIAAPRDIPVRRKETISSETEGTLVETQEEVSMAADKEPDCNA
jgi:carbon storage regulator